MNTTPPNFPSSGATAESTRWPQNLGIIAIVFGSCGALQGLCGLASVFAIGPITKMMEKFVPATAGGPTPASTFAAMQKFAAWTIASNVFAGLVAVLLIVGGAQLIKRRAKCRVTILQWCGLKFLVAASASVLGYLIARDQFALIASDGTTAASPIAPNTMVGVAMIGQVVGFLWYIALPIFMIIWLNRPRIRTEVVSWG